MDASEYFLLLVMAVPVFVWPMIVVSPKSVLKPNCVAALMIPLS